MGQNVFITSKASPNKTLSTQISQNATWPWYLKLTTATLRTALSNAMMRSARKNAGALAGALLSKDAYADPQNSQIFSNCGLLQTEFRSILESMISNDTAQWMLQHEAEMTIESHFLKDLGCALELGAR